MLPCKKSSPPDQGELVESDERRLNVTRIFDPEDMQCHCKGSGALEQGLFSDVVHALPSDQVLKSGGLMRDVQTIGTSLLQRMPRTCSRAAMSPASVMPRVISAADHPGSTLVAMRNTSSLSRAVGGRFLRALNTRSPASGSGPGA